MCSSVHEATSESDGDKVRSRTSSPYPEASDQSMVDIVVQEPFTITQLEQFEELFILLSYIDNKDVSRIIE